MPALHFPNTFVSPDPIKPTPAPVPAPAPTVQASATKASKPKASSTSTASVPTFPPGKKVAVAKYRFKPQMEGDLALEKGEYVVVTDDTEEWWIGYKVSNPKTEGCAHASRAVLRFAFHEAVTDGCLKQRLVHTLAA
eukprot:SAG31_NODE_10182_length_1174_cov_1.051163_2_plen_137_part_00